MFSLETIPEGYRVWKDKIFLFAVIATKHQDQKLKTNAGGVVWSPMEKKDWHIHLTNPNVSVDDLKAVTAVLPSEA